MHTKFLVGIFVLLLSPLVLSDEVNPGVLRTPEARFANLQGYPFESHYIVIDGMRIHYLDEGPNDGETLFLLHGEPAWSFLFRKMIPIFTEAGYRVVVPDLVGFGKSDKYVDEAAYSYGGQVEFMRKLVERLDLNEVTFFGQDWGGLIGLRVVAETPDRFSRIVVSNTSLPGAGGLFGRFGYDVIKLYLSIMGEITLQDLQSELTFMRWAAYSQHVDDLPIGDAMTVLGGGKPRDPGYEAPFPDGRYKAGAHIMPYLVPSELPQNQQAWENVFESWDKPFLVAFTDQDPITAGGEELFMERVPSAQQVTIRGAGHFVQEDAGPELADLMIAFMQGQALPREISAGAENP